MNDTTAKIFLAEEVAELRKFDLETIARLKQDNIRLAQENRKHKDNANRLYMAKLVMADIGATADMNREERLDYLGDLLPSHSRAVWLLSNILYDEKLPLRCDKCNGPLDEEFTCELCAYRNPEEPDKCPPRPGADMGRVNLR